MPTLRTTYHPGTRVADVALAGTAVPAGAVAVGNFTHPDPVYPGSVVVFHGVRDLLYKRSHANPANAAMFPNNITDMDRISISLRQVTGIDATAAGGNLAVAATRQIAVAFLPAGAVNAQGLVYESSHPDRATVSNTGLVTGVAAGAVVITVKTTDGKFMDTVNITVA